MHVFFSQKLQVYEDADFLHNVAMIRENIVKNRCPDVLPCKYRLLGPCLYFKASSFATAFSFEISVDRNRVSVTCLDQTSNLDYINASFIDVSTLRDM